MNEKAAIEQRLSRRARPNPDDVAEDIFHGLKREQTHGVVQQMHRHVGEHHQAGAEAQPPDH
jgi:hypothetical protein